MKTSETGLAPQLQEQEQSSLDKDTMSDSASRATLTTRGQSREQTGHTPAPWIFDGQSILVGNTRHMLRDGVGWSQADARLIAAAPDLLAAITKTLNENLNLADGENCTLIHLKRAFAKAEGRSFDSVVEERIKYSVVGNHPVLARPDKSGMTFNEAVAYSEELIAAGFEGVVIREYSAPLISSDEKHTENQG